MIHRTSHFSLAVALAALVLTTGCYEKKSGAAGDVDGRLGRLAKSGAGNGDGYLGLVSSSYQVLPGYECSDGTTSRLAYAAALVETASGDLLLASDQCENQAVPIRRDEVKLLEKDGSKVMVRGGIFERRETAPNPVNKKDRYTQVNCQWKGGARQFTISVKSNMAGDDMEFGIHTKWTEPGAEQKSHRWIAKFLTVTSETTGSTVTYRSTEADLLLTIDLSRTNHYKGKKFYGTVRYVTETENVQLDNLQCLVNRRVSFEP
ncbi:MAG TPA: hypothetical protein VM598_08645 [Bdellovibrionota bacterium]|nr:hypothetical protein [Bdellovibrionota bacterium]